MALDTILQQEMVSIAQRNAQEFNAHNARLVSLENAADDNTYLSSGAFDENTKQLVLTMNDSSSLSVDLASLYNNTAEEW